MNYATINLHSTAWTLKRSNPRRIFFFSFILHLSIISTFLFLFLQADPSARNGNCVAEKFKDGGKKYFRSILHSF